MATNVPMPVMRLYALLEREDDPKKCTAAKLVRLGVDGLITDRPDLARTLLEERGVRWR